MSRPIEFQIWTGAKMLEVFGLNPKTQTAYVSSVQLTGNAGDDILIPYYDVAERGEEYDHSCRLRRFTGLLDMNGNKIFEGDIVKYVSLDQPDLRPDLYEIEWRGYGFEARWMNPLSPRFTSDGHLSLHGADQDMVVIGNIYEHPELMERMS